MLTPDGSAPAQDAPLRGTGTRDFLTAVAVFPGAFDIIAAAAIAGSSRTEASILAQDLVGDESLMRWSIGEHGDLFSLDPRLRAHFSARPPDLAVRARALESHVRHFLLDAPGPRERLHMQEPVFADFWRTNVELAAARHVRHLLSSVTPPADEVSVEALTERQWQVARLVARGRTNDQIARELGIARWTAINHLRSIMRKLNCASRVDVTRFVLNNETDPGTEASTPA